MHSAHSRLLRRPFAAGLLAGALLVFAVRLVITETTLPDQLLRPLLVDNASGRADAIVVLGGGLIGECAVNVNSLRRVLLAARLFRDDRAPVMVITGGTREGGCPVADAMMDIAGELGVPDEKLYVERHSRSTRENAVETAPLLRELGARTIVLVTDRLHMRRAAGSFREQGFEIIPAAVPIYEGHADNVDMLAAGLREFAALGYYSMRGWMSSTPIGERAATKTNAERERTAPRHPEGPVVILGASYAGNWPIDSTGSVPVVNAGIAGQRTFQFVERFEHDVVARHPRAVLLWGFINDYFSADNFEQAAAGVRANYEEMIGKARAAGIEPILATEITTLPGSGWMDTVRGLIGRIRGRQSYQERINSQVMATNAWLRELAQKQGLLLLDFQRALAEPSGERRRQYATDDNHVTPAGYEALTRYVRPILARHFAPDGSAAPAGNDSSSGIR